MKDRKFKKAVPLGARLLVRRAKAPDRTVGGLFLPDTAKKKVDYGEVLAVGEGEMPPGWGHGVMEKDGGAVKKPIVGKVVCFSHYSGKDMPDDVEGADLLVILNSDEVLAVLE